MYVVVGRVGHALNVGIGLVAAVVLSLAVLSCRQRGRLIHELHRKKRQESDRQAILEMIARRRPLHLIFERVVRSIAVNCPGARAVVLRFHTGRTDVCGASTLPEAAVRGFEGLSSEGRAFDELWRTLHEEADRHGLRCHFSPLRSGSDELYGAIVIHGMLNRPRQSDIVMISALSNLAGAAIDSVRLYERLAFQAGHDTLTALPNRLSFESTLGDALLVAANTGQELAVFFLDLDRFKQINDSLGHRVGDLFLKKVAERIRNALPREATLARIGGDEFTILLPQSQEPLWIDRAADRVLIALRPPCVIEGHQLFPSASIGISVYPKDGADAVTLQKRADSAMYRAKSQGKNRFAFFSDEMAISTAMVQEIEPVLRNALRTGRFRMHYQPQFTMRHQLDGVEALLRLDHPDRGLIGPSIFIPLAEETRLIVPIGEWVVREACSQLQRWAKDGLIVPRIAINVSAVQFAENSFASMLGRILRETGTDPRLLELEIAASSIMEDLAGSVPRLQKLKALGLRIAADHFGAGYSSLASIQRLPVEWLDRLKIDRAFTDGLDAGISTVPLVKAICTLAQNLGLATAVTAIERETQMDLLTEIHDGNVQGYLLGRPGPPDRMSELLFSVEHRWTNAVHASP